MLKKFVKKILLSGTKKEIQRFIDLFAEGGVDQNGIIVGVAAIMHYSLANIDSEFKKLLNSKLGENQNEITIYNMTHLDGLNKEYHKANEMINAAGIKFWSINFRCMIDETLHHYGLQLWKVASKSFDSAKDYLNHELIKMMEVGNAKMVKKIEGALKIYNYIPPQFVEEN